MDNDGYRIISGFIKKFIYNNNDGISHAVMMDMAIITYFIYTLNYNG